MKFFASNILAAFGVSLFLSAHSVAAEPSDACVADSGISYVCGLMNAEDLLSVGDSGLIITSGMTGEGENGHLYLIDTRDNSWHDLASAPNFSQDFDSVSYSSCPGLFDVTNFSAHGLALRETGADVFDLYITSHGGREAIEMFDLSLAGGDAKLTWRGCVPLDESIMHNSVAILADGGFATTQFMEWEKGIAASVTGQVKGGVVIWRPGSESAVLVGSEMAGPNGIVVSDDNRYLYVAALGTRELVRFDLSQEPVASDSVALDIILDNIRWGESGKLLTAGGNAGGNGWSVVEVDAASLEATRIGGMDGDAALQRVSSALQVGDQIWVGTYSGDRVGYFARD